MTTEVIGLPRGRSLTRDDLDLMPDDGHRYEIAWTLRDGAYVEAASATGAEPLTVEQPFPISVTPASLIEN